MLFWSFYEKILAAIYIATIFSPKAFTGYLDTSFLLWLICFQIMQKVRIFYLILAIVWIYSLLTSSIDLFAHFKIIPLFIRLIPLLNFKKLCLFYEFKPTGPYKVGYKDTYAGGVYYPCEPTANWVRYSSILKHKFCYRVNTQSPNGSETGNRPLKDFGWHGHSVNLTHNGKNLSIGIC